MSIALDALILLTGWTHVLLAPYTKVEESFSLHATHDVLMYGVAPSDLHNYDHFTFPGAVPRTFIGSVVLAWLSIPVIRLAAWMGYVATKFELQIIVRLVLATLNALSLCVMRRGVSKRFGRTTGLFFALLTCSQFHLPFWMGRTIPNMFALIPVNTATSLLLTRAPNSTRPSDTSITWVIALLTSSAVIFRAEIALLLAPLCLELLVGRQITLVRLLKLGIVSGVSSLALTVCVDSYFWDTYPLWPEFSGIYFNIIQGKSSQWGTSPASTYVTSYLPKLLLGALPLAGVGVVSDGRVRALLTPAAVFVALISGLGHKEWRFVVYVVPVFNVAAARGAKWMVSRRKGSLWGRLCFLATSALIAGNVLATILFTRASMGNYPGGHALAQFHHLYPFGSTSPPPHIHISNLAAQTGASLFLHLHSPPHFFPSPSSPSWTYNKTEIPLPSLSPRITHVLSEELLSGGKWRVVEAVRAFGGFKVDWELLRGGDRGRLLERVGAGEVVGMMEKDGVWILERS
ncbi:alpha-1,6-mannosyltransferase subunit [Crassisporium funariophilum]|nr:alpha-1,6-mannosyltransferase subunit [Crassisporium funariophilum]